MTKLAKFGGKIPEEEKKAPLEEIKKADKEDSTIKLIETKSGRVKRQHTNSKYDTNKYTSEQLEVLEKIDAGTELTADEKKIKDEIEELRDNDLHGLFGDEDEVKEEDMKVDDVPDETFVLLTEDQPETEKARNALLNNLRSFMESYQVKRHLQLVNIFVKTAVKASYPLEMLMNVASPYHIRLLLKLLVIASSELKVLIIKILKTLLRVEIHLETLEKATQAPIAELKTKSTIKFRSTFVQTLYDLCLQIREGTWIGPIEDEKESLFDVQHNISKLIALFFKLRQSQIDPETTTNEELSAIFTSDIKSLPKEEKNLIHSILGSFLTLPVCGDKVLNIEKESNVAKPFTILASNKLNKTLNDSIGSRITDFHQACTSVIVPDVAPDSLIDLTLSVEGIEKAIDRLNEIKNED